MPNQVVDVNSVNLFKTRLDKFRRCQNVVFDFRADLAGIGDRSECVMLNVTLVKSYIADVDIETRCVCVRFIIDYYCNRLSDSLYVYTQTILCPRVTLLSSDF